MDTTISTPSSAAKPGDVPERDLLHAREVVERVVGRGLDLTADYHQWVTLGFAFASLGEEGRPLYHRVSCLHPRYKVEDCDDKFTHCLIESRNQVGVATFFHLAKAAGVDVSLPAALRGHRGRPRKEEAGGAATADAAGGDPSTLIHHAAGGDSSTLFHHAEQQLDAMAEFRFNIVTRKTEFRFRPARAGAAPPPWKPLDDRSFNQLFVRVRKGSINLSKENVQAIIENPVVSPDYNPFVEYLDALPAWDGTDDHIGRVFDHLVLDGGDAERAFCLPLLHKWFVRMVALWTGRVDDNQVMPVLVGPAHVGKTYFCTHLLPPPLRDYAKVVFPGEHDDRDRLIALSEKGLLVMDEYEFNHRTSNAMRAIITSTGSSVRAPYGRYSENRHRVASFIGSCNNALYIGESRYLSVPVKGTNHFTDDTLPLAQAYAQAWHLIRGGSRADYTFTVADTRSIEGHNADFIVPDLCEELVRTLYRVPGPDEQGKMVGFGEIMSRLHQYNTSSEVNTRRVSTALRRLGFELHKSRSCNRWYVMEVTFDENRMAAVNEGHRRYLELHPDPPAAD